MWIQRNFRRGVQRTLQNGACRFNKQATLRRYQTKQEEEQQQQQQIERKCVTFYGAINEGNGASRHKSRRKSEAVQRSTTKLHIYDERKVHSSKDKRLYEDLRSDGRNVVSQVIHGAENLPQELPGWNMEQDSEFS